MEELGRYKIDVEKISEEPDGEPKSEANCFNGYDFTAPSRGDYAVKLHDPVNIYHILSLNAGDRVSYDTEPKNGDINSASSYHSNYYVLKYINKKQNLNIIFKKYRVEYKPVNYRPNFLFRFIIKLIKKFFMKKRKLRLSDFE